MISNSCVIRTDDTGKELVQHGTTLFPAAFYTDDMKEIIVSWHWHEDLEVGYVAKGSVTIMIDSEKYILEEGEGFFINSGVLHEMEGNGDTERKFCSIVFHPRLVGGSVDSIFWQKYVQPLIENTSLKGIKLNPKTEHHKEVLEAIEYAWESGAKEEKGYELKVRNALSELLLLVTEKNEKSSGNVSSKVMRDDSRIKKMLAYIQEHYQEEIRTEQIADSASISESECLRCFRNTIRTTPIQFLKEFRLQKAAQLLNTTEQKVVDIGVQCGFQDMSYFAKTFRAVYGCTPSEYRDKNKFISHK